VAFRSDLDRASRLGDERGANEGGQGSRSRGDGASKRFAPATDAENRRFLAAESAFALAEDTSRSKAAQRLCA